jgi:E3 ubiquitin-protein ligase RNF144
VRVHAIGGKRTYCPVKDCSAKMLVDNDNDFAESECPSCACAVARRRYLHRVQEQKGGRGIEDMMLLEMAKGKNWKRCPKCEFFVEKRDGCLHVTCR